MVFVVGQTVYSTRKALTRGIEKRQVQEVHESSVTGPYVVLSGALVGEPGRDVFSTIEAAQEKAQDMAKCKIKTLDKQRAKMTEIAKNGAKVVE